MEKSKFWKLCLFQSLNWVLGMDACIRLFFLPDLPPVNKVGSYHIQGYMKRLADIYQDLF